MKNIFKIKAFRIKNRGFTLIELLITIALMLSILGIAIVSFVGVSDRKKQEAYQDVVSQIETAGEMYFQTNSYLFDGLDDGAVGVIALGKLVSEDYLNRVTDPRTGKAIPYCSYVEVKKENGRYTTKYVESSENDPDQCSEEGYTIVVTEPGGPSITVNPEQYPGTGRYDNWYGDRVNFRMNAKNNNNGAIVKVESCNASGNGIYCNNYSQVFDYSITSDGATALVTNDPEKSDATTCYKATNGGGKSAVACASAKVDKNAPTCSSSVKSSNDNQKHNGWFNSNTGAPTITFTGKDNESGINGATTVTKTPKEGNNVNYKQTFVDKVGHETTCQTNVSYDKTKPSCSIKSTPNGKNGWFVSDAYFTINSMPADVDTWSWNTDSGWSSGTLNYATQKPANQTNLYMSNEGQRKVTVNMTDKAGNTGSCSSTLKIDKTKPTCKVNTSGTKGKIVSGRQWFLTSNVSVSLTKSDGGSGVDTYGLATSANSTNKKTTGTQSAQTGANGVTWYGYVQDKAGNTTSCNSNFGLEKSVTMSFTEANRNLTNTSVSYNPGADSNGKQVFNGSGSCGFGQCSTINCYTNNNFTSQCPKAYFANSCMNVNNFARYFTVNSPSAGGSGVVVRVDGDPNQATSGIKRSSEHYGYQCTKGGKYNVWNCGISSSWATDATAHTYTYTSPAGLSSNPITLYVEYSADCGYIR